MDSICDLVGVNACFLTFKILFGFTVLFVFCFSFWSSICFFCRSWWLFAAVYQEFREGEDQWGPAAAHHTSGTRGSGSQPHRPSGADFGSGWPSVCTGKGIRELNFCLFVCFVSSFPSLYKNNLNARRKKKSPNYQPTGCGIFLLHCICVMPCQITNWGGLLTQFVAFYLATWKTKSSPREFSQQHLGCTIAYNHL